MAIENGLVDIAASKSHSFFADSRQFLIPSAAALLQPVDHFAKSKNTAIRIWIRIPGGLPHVNNLVVSEFSI